MSPFRLFDMQLKMKAEALLGHSPLLAGMDEVGRGSLAGPVVVSAVILDVEGMEFIGLNDSKQVTGLCRVRLFQQICLFAREVSIGLAWAWEIDVFNVYQATLLAMDRAICKLHCRPDIVVTDGMPWHSPGVMVENIVRCDQKSESVAAASIVAKVWRDRWMDLLDERYPGYLWKNNKGYPTWEHRRRLERFGFCFEHRKSFSPVRQMFLVSCGGQAQHHVC